MYSLQLESTCKVTFFFQVQPFGIYLGKSILGAKTLHLKKMSLYMSDSMLNFFIDDNYIHGNQFS